MVVMPQTPEPEADDAFADRLDQALEALWQGDGTSLDGLLKDTRDASPPVRELFRGVLTQAAESSATVGTQVGEYTIIREIGR
ncbi:MAG: hypothetical protein KAY37_15265, partial [Phycisphaerae bacterium]|nr:hypothetical protein [Phycisphaerae bacterium]